MSDARPRKPAPNAENAAPSISARFPASPKPPPANGVDERALPRFDLDGLDIAVLGKGMADRVGVTGSIPVAPTRLLL